MIIEHICKQFMGWDFPETSWFSVCIYTSRHKTTKAVWERLRGVVNAQRRLTANARRQITNALFIFIKPTIVFWVNLINRIHNIPGK